MPYVEKTIKSGDMLEVERYHVRKITNKGPRTPIHHDSDEDQQELNNRRAVKKLRRKIYANFNGKQGDIFVTLTYSEDEGEVTEEQAKKEIENFLRRVRYHRRKLGMDDLKYIEVTEKQSKWHHHIIMNAMPEALIYELWGRGRVSYSRLDGGNQFRDLTNYLLAEEKDAKKNSKTPPQKSRAASMRADGVVAGILKSPWRVNQRKFHRKS